MSSMLSLSLLALCAPADGEAVSTAFEFRDAVKCEDRSLLFFRQIELHEQPVKPLAGESPTARGAAYGQLAVGPTPETALAVIWHAKAGDAPTLCFDANGDGNLTADERHVVSGRQICLPATVTVQIKPAVKRVSRTIVFRRPLLGSGLQYAVQGYAVGKLDFNSREHAVLLVDGDADGRLNSVGRDRVWIDLNRDDRFDGLSEQFPMGRPIIVAGNVYLVRSDPLATAVSASLRPSGEGQVRLALAQRWKPVRFSAYLVSHLGELVTVDRANAPVPVPEGTFHIGSVRLELTDDSGVSWTYGFGDLEEKLFDVRPGQETNVSLLESPEMSLRLQLRGPSVRPGDQVLAVPRVTADGGTFHLVDCTRRDADSSATKESKAKIRLLDPEGKVVSQTSSGFA